MSVDIDDHFKRMEEWARSRIPKDEFKLTRHGPDRNAIWTTYLAFVSGEISRPLPNGYWPDRLIYGPKFIGPLPPQNRWLIPWSKRDHSTGLVILHHYDILPDPEDLIEFIRTNATSPIKLSYGWYEKGRRKPTWSKDRAVFNIGGDPSENVQFERLLRNVITWLEWEEACSAHFDFDDLQTGGKFKMMFKERT